MRMPPVTFTIRSVNTGMPRDWAWAGIGYTSIEKLPVAGPVRVGKLGLEGDQVSDVAHHGGVDQAVYAFAREDLDAWVEALGQPIRDGLFGENLTTDGLDVSGALIGERWRIGTVELEVCQPRQPCSKLGLRFEDLRMVKRFAHASRPGAYLRILTEGELGAGDAIEITHRPDHAVTVALVADAVLLDDALIPQVVGAPALPERLREWMLAQAA